MLGARLGGFCWRLDEVLVMFDGLLFRFLPTIEAVAGGAASDRPACSDGAVAYFLAIPWLFDIVVAIAPDPVFFLTFTVF